jgi:hypothetical protein
MSIGMRTRLSIDVHNNNPDTLILGKRDYETVTWDLSHIVGCRKPGLKNTEDATYEIKHHLDPF